MTNLTDKQREALEALRDVMKEHDIEVHFCQDYDWFGFNILAGDFATKQTEQACIAALVNKDDFSHECLTKLLEQETE